VTEDDLIAKFFAPLAGPSALGLKDDTALYAPPPGHELVLTVDAIVAGVHFFPGDPPESIARKALRVNISDIAAKGAEPQGFLMTFAMPKDSRSAFDIGWLERFVRALGDDAKLWRCPLMGGDTVSTPGPLSISITVVGAVPAGRMVKRTGAQVGDAIYVSGTIGDAALGLYVHGGKNEPWIERLSPQQRDYLVQRYLEPQPRLELASVIREFANGSMDVSDGLAGDLAKMMRVSGTSARIELARVPLSEAVRAACADERAFEIAVTGGDDYEILFTVPEGRNDALERALSAADIPVTFIGTVAKGPNNLCEFVEKNGNARQFTRASFSHF
jgi:thiamine-monophosphate kinase